MTSYLPVGIQNSMQQGCGWCEGYITQAQEYYEKVENLAIGGLKQVLPDKLAPLSERVGKAIPEALFSAAMLTGTLMPLALIYWAARVVWIVAPIAKSVVSGDLQQEAMKNATQECLTRLDQQCDKFVPAIAVSCAVGAVACGLFGALTLSPRLIMQGTFMATLSYLAYRNMMAAPNQPTPQ